jgi:amino acid transporter
MKDPSPSAAPGLIRALGPLMATAVVVGTVIGSGVFKKPQTVAENVPSFGTAALVWIAVGLLAFLGGLTLAEIAVLFPRAGGNYVFLREGYGRLAGFLWGWVEFWIIRSASLAALATIFTESLHDVLRSSLSPGSDVLGYWDQRLLTVLVILVLAYVNVRGVRWGGGLQFLITTVKVGSLLAITALPFVILALGRRVPQAVPDYLSLLGSDPAGGFPGGVSWAGLAQVQQNQLPAPRALAFGSLFTAVLGVLWAYHGWMNIAWVAEEVRNPQRNIPLALLSGIGIVIVLYLGANLAYYLVIPWGEMAGLKDTTVATVFSLRLLGPVGAVAMSAAVMCSVFGALNGNLLVGPRLLYAMGEDGLVPAALRAVHPRYHTPALAIWVLAGWACLLVLGVAALTALHVLPADKSHFEIMTNFAMFGAVIFETLAVATIFVFRRRMPHAKRPYRCWGYPVVPLLYMIIPALILGNMFVKQQVEAATGVGFIAVGVAVYYWLGLARTRPKERLAVKHLSLGRQSE